MDLTLFTGDYAYSSWSLRGWLLLDAFGVPFRLRYARLGTEAFSDMRDEMAPSRLVPALKVGTGDAAFTVWESLAIAETAHELMPEAGIWPADPALRGTARALAAEMHAGFGALRSECPMNMRRAYAGFTVSEAVRADLDRLTELWSLARSVTDGAGPFLFGAFSAADAFFAPVASRIATYGLPMDAADRDYVAALLEHPSVRRWRAMGMADAHIQAHYEMDLPERPNPHDPAVTGTPVREASVNANCPYSGKPVAEDSVISVGGKKIGFCNPFCAAKTAADPYAWPKAAALLETG